MRWSSAPTPGARSPTLFEAEAGDAVERQGQGCSRSCRTAFAASVSQRRRRRRPCRRARRGVAAVRHACSPRLRASAGAAASSSCAATPASASRACVAEFGATRGSARLRLPRRGRCSTSAPRPAATRCAAWRGACSAWAADGRRAANAARRRARLRRGDDSRPRTRCSSCTSCSTSTPPPALRAIYAAAMTRDGARARRR